MHDQAQAVLQMLQTLRTIHGDFSDRPVTEEDEQTILASAIRAANSSARQAYSIISLSGMERVKKLCTYPAPRAMVFLSDHSRLQDEARRRGYGMRPYSVYEMIATTIDASLAAGNAILAAKALGLDSMVTNSLLDRVDKDMLVEELAIPAYGCMPLFAVLFGYAKTEPEQKRQRYAGPGLFHKERYHRLREEELSAMSDRYDDPGMGVVFANWREQGYEGYFDWYFRAWDTMPGTENYRERGPGWAVDYAARAGYL